MFRRRQRQAAASPEGAPSGEIDRRRLMRLGGGAAASAAVVGIAGGPAPAGALAVQGTASFARSGVVSMVSSRQTVSVPGGLTHKSRVLATINSDPDQLGYFPVVAAAPDPRTGTIKLQTNSFAGQPPYPEVAWFVFD